MNFMRSLFSILIWSLSFSCQAQEEQKPYTKFIEEVLAKKNDFKIKYEAAGSLQKDSVLIEAREFLIQTIATELFPYWYGTEWDFNGTTRTPREGKIACGYFITNILTDVGFSIPRVKWAQAPSEVFIKKLAKESLKRFSNTPIEEVEKYLIESGNGLYLVGLDYHTGFIYVNEKEVRFIHADYYEPEKGVVSEELDSFSPIADSSYRVIGKLLSDEMMLSWIKDLAIP